MATGVLTLVGSTVGTVTGAVSRITGVLGKSLATLTFDEEYKASRIRRREPGDSVVTDIATGGKNVVMVITRNFIHRILIDRISFRGDLKTFTQVEVYFLILY